MIAELATRAEAQALLAAAAEAIEACASYEDDGVSYELERERVQGLGEESVGARVTGETAAGELEGPLYYVRVGRRVVILALLALGDSPDDVARQAVEAVVARL